MQAVQPDWLPEGLRPAPRTRIVEVKTPPVPAASSAQEAKLPKTEIASAIDAHPNAREIVWVQEEPANMGALFYVLPRLERIAQAKNLRVRSVKRSASASPATGSAKAHELEQKTLLTLAFATTSNS